MSEEKTPSASIGSSKFKAPAPRSSLTHESMMRTLARRGSRLSAAI